MRHLTSRINARCRYEDMYKAKRLLQDHKISGVHSISDLVVKAMLDLYDKHYPTELEIASAIASPDAGDGFVIPISPVEQLVGAQVVVAKQKPQRPKRIKKGKGKSPAKKNGKPTVKAKKKAKV